MTEEKWWYRLLKVLYIGAWVLIGLITVVIFLEEGIGDAFIFFIICGAILYVVSLAVLYVIFGAKNYGTNLRASFSQTGQASEGKQILDLMYSNAKDREAIVDEIITGLCPTSVVYFLAFCEHHTKLEESLEDLPLVAKFWKEKYLQLMKNYNSGELQEVIDKTYDELVPIAVMSLGMSYAKMRLPEDQVDNHEFTHEEIKRYLEELEGFEEKQPRLYVYGFFLYIYESLSEFNSLFGKYTDEYTGGGGSDISPIDLLTKKIIEEKKKEVRNKIADEGMGIIEEARENILNKMQLRLFFMLHGLNSIYTKVYLTRDSKVQDVYECLVESFMYNLRMFSSIELRMDLDESLLNAGRNGGGNTKVNVEELGGIECLTLTVWWVENKGKYWSLQESIQQQMLELGKEEK